MIHEITKLKIEARCEAYNESHKLLIQAAPAIYQWVKSMEGQSIYKKDGTLFEKFYKTKPQFQNVWIECGDYSIRAEARYSSVSRSYTDHHGREQTIHEGGGFSVYFADVKSGVVSVHEGSSTPQLRTDYDAAEVISALEKLQEIEKQVSDITSGLHHCISARLQINHP